MAGLFFVQSNKARELLVTFFDKLREDRKLEESMVFARDLPESQLKDRLHATMASTFSGSVDRELIFALLEGVAKANKKTRDRSSSSSATDQLPITDEKVPASEAIENGSRDK